MIWGSGGSKSRLAKAAGAGDVGTGMGGDGMVGEVDDNDDAVSSSIAPVKR